ncbi:hypothetical protein D9757_008412 [Collybiopsis confluens]|uniref:Uncharacterized protein n=1 Tax=Collybiopsis confluens TaxID=2823264 RepID=A0A8H5HHA1_9AGAR|nr:hypothetical protein D9757_013335 [Collybiopsis confluens]KAF5383337.1 hypothetical protein D9757_008412 [Collybiopsis confluens]
MKLFTVFIDFITAFTTTTTESTLPGEALIVAPGPSRGNFSASYLNRACSVRSRQQAHYYPPGSTSQKSLNFGGYGSAGDNTLTNWLSAGIPDGSAINPILDVSFAGDVDINYWYTVDSSTTCRLNYVCEGNLIGGIKYGPISVTC